MTKKMKRTESQDSEAQKKIEREKSSVEEEKGDITSMGVYGSMPIAEYYEHTTIMFADLVGFTSWSSTREPAEVFFFT